MIRESENYAPYCHYCNSNSVERVNPEGRSLIYKCYLCGAYIENPWVRLVGSQERPDEAAEEEEKR